jgi:hypothetical protein
MPTDKEKLYSITVTMIKVCGLPEYIFGFDVKKLAWQEICKRSDQQIQTALFRLRELTK